ncbi:MAG: YlbF family regulator [Verrucomicrobiales bacterium]|nr:YlbF family regulator [Verrucomicrobiales bacterium]
MEVLSPNSAILDKTRELCTLILQSGEYQENVEKIETFFKNDDAQATYKEFAELGETLHQKQQAGLLSDEDVSGYDEKLKALKADPITGEFMEAEQTLNGIVAQISKTVGKTLELGRLPEPEDMEEGGCCGGGGCGC